MREFAKRNENLIIAAVITAVMALIVGIGFDYCYQANDDIMIKNILSGVYTGTPESRNVQMHYPMSLFISLLYRVARNLPWYGLLLCMAHFFSFFYIAYNTGKAIEKTWVKTLVLCAEGVFFTGALLYELVFTQYTVTCGLLAAAAMFGFYMSDRSLEPKEFIKVNIPNIILIFVAFVTRSEMLLLMLPYICVAGFFKWTDTDKSRGEKAFDKKSLIKYFGTFAIILASLGVGQLIHAVAYSGSEWKEFIRFFDNRTELYDYQFIPSYEGNESFYDGIGLDESEVALLENYNFGLDSNITADTLREVADYAKTLKGEKAGLIASMRSAVPDYKYILRFGQSSDPYGRNWEELYVAAMALLILLLIVNSDLSRIWQPILLFAVRSGLWLYMISTGRYPARITHPMYFIEIVLLIAMFLTYAKREKRRPFPWVSVLALVIMTVLSLGVFAANYREVERECAGRDKANEEKLALEAYAKTHPDNYYLIDVYSFVSSMNDHVEYSEKIFENVDNSYANYDYLGGWIMNSPHTWVKLVNYGIDKEKGEIEKSIVNNDNVYLIVRNDRDTEWVTDYGERVMGEALNVEKTDEVADIYGVYAVSR